MARAHAFVLSSLWEGFPNVLLEAMARGSAILSTDCHSGLRELITHEVDGLLVPPADPVALGDAIGRVLTDSDLRYRLAQSGRQRARDFAGDDTIASREVRMSGQRFGEVVELTWQGGVRFEARAGDLAVVLDSERQAGLSPVQALAVALTGCMAMDVVDILQKGRFALDGMQVRFAGERATDPPRRFTRMALHFVVSGHVPSDRVERAIALSRERYCSVWHSLRPDIDFHTSFEIARTRGPDPSRVPGPQGDERHGVAGR
jgi:putative redox protein